MIELTCDSFFIELVMLHAYQSTPFTQDSGVFLKAVYARFFELLSMGEELSISWNAFYDPIKAQSVFPQKRPLVLDPSNPTNNVASRISNWSEIRTEAAKPVSKMETSHLVYLFVDSIIRAVSDYICRLRLSKIFVLKMKV